MAWIESHQSLLGHRKTGRLARSLDISRVVVVGHLHAFWWWCLDNAQDGRLVDADAFEIAEAACWTGDAEAFQEAMITAGFIDRDSAGNLTVHDWMEYAGKLIERRKSDRARKRSYGNPQEFHRSSDGIPPDGARTQPNRTQPYPTQPNTTQPKENDAPSAPAADAPVGSLGSDDAGQVDEEHQEETPSPEQTGNPIPDDDQEEETPPPRSAAPPSKKPARYSAAFEAFWSIRRWDGSKAEAWTAWTRLKLDRDEDLRGEVFRGARDEIAIRAAREKSGMWTENWKHAVRWLRHRMWENPPAWPESGPVIPIQRGKQPYGVSDEDLEAFRAMYGGQR